MLNYLQQATWQPKSGHFQSPINLVTKDALPVEELTPKLQIFFKKDSGQQIENEQNLQFYKPGAAILNGRKFQFKQVHFHTKSEHQIDGEVFDLEGHFVYQGVNGRMAVIAVFYRIGAENTGFSEILAGLFGQENIRLANLTELLPRNKSYYHYLGSLTTPPLVENVEWYLLKEHLTISSAQLAHFNQKQGHNQRALQPLNNRVILTYDEKKSSLS